MNSDRVEFFPHIIPFPQVKLKDYLKQAASDRMSVLAKPPSTTVPTLAAGDKTRNAILELAFMLKRANKCLIFKKCRISYFRGCQTFNGIAPPKAKSDNHHDIGLSFSINSIQ